MKTAEEIYEANRPKYRDWGTLKDMCIASMDEYAQHVTEQQSKEIERLKEGIEHWEKLALSGESEKDQLLKEMADRIDVLIGNCENYGIEHNSFVTQAERTLSKYKELKD